MFRNKAFEPDGDASGSKGPSSKTVPRFQATADGSLWKVVVITILGVLSFFLLVALVAGIAVHLHSQSQWEREIKNVASESSKLSEKLNMKTSALNDALAENAKLNESLKNVTSEFSNMTKVKEQLKEQVDAGCCLATCNGVYIKAIPITAEDGTVTYRNVSTDDENWIVFQRRRDGCVSFNRNWKHFVKGFGMPCGEYWLGLDAIYLLTRNGDQELRIDMVEKNSGTHYYAKYSDFTIGPASDNYRIRVGGFSGNATNAFQNAPDYGIVDGQQFSTYDAEHDSSSELNCAAVISDGWWHKACSFADLNAPYDGLSQGNHAEVYWRNIDTNSDIFLKFVEMKIRTKN